MARTFVLLFCCIAVLGGCSRHHKNLEISKKERLVSELISSSAQCVVYKDQLKSTTLKDDDVDDIYHAAMRAHCINRDV